MNGLQWYKKIYNFLSSHECYLVIVQNESQKLSLIELLNKNINEGIRLNARYKKYGLYVSRGKHGNAAVVTQNIAKEFCAQQGYNLDTKKDFVIPYTKKDFSISHELKNIHVHKGKKIPKQIPYKEQLKTKEWIRFRKVVFKSRGRTCEMCGATTNLQIHHPKYISGRKAWEYTIEDVMVLCRKCHETTHNI